MNGSTEVVDVEKTQVIAGFVVPKFPEYTNLSVTPETWGGQTEACFEVNLLRANVDKQIEDLEEILSQKCDSSTVEEVISYVKQKKKRFDTLPNKYIYDNKSKRYIWIRESTTQDINIFYGSENFFLNNN